MEQIFDQLFKKVHSGELFKINHKATPVDYEMNQLKSVNLEEIEGCAVRIIYDGKIGFSSSTGLEHINKTIDRAIEVSPFGQIANFHFPEQIIPPMERTPKTYDPSVREKSFEEMIEVGNKIMERVYLLNPDYRCDAGITKNELEVQYWNTCGGEFSYQKTMFSQSIMIQNTTDHDMMMLNESQDWGKDELSLDDLWEKIEEKIKWGDKIVGINNGALPAIFTPKALLVLMLPLISGLNGKFINKKISPLQDKKDQLLWSPLFSLYSDGTIDYALGSAPYDDEGIMMQCFPLVEKGVLKNYYYDLQSAAEAGEKPTGNGIRPGFFTSPSPGITNLILLEGETTLQEMIQDMKEGIIIDQVLGLGQGNVLSGAFSNNVHLGYKVENGKVVGRIKNVMIAGNAFEVLKDIVAISNNARWISGQYLFPHVYVKELSVSTK